MERIYRQDLQQEAACARRRDAGRADAHLAQLHDARRQFRFGRLRSRQRRGARPAFQRQLPRDQLRGARRCGEEAARRCSRRPRDAPDAKRRRRTPAAPGIGVSPASRGIVQQGPGGSASLTIPLTVTRIARHRLRPRRLAGPYRDARGPFRWATYRDFIDENEGAVAADYRDRDGYQAGLSSATAICCRPARGRRAIADDVLDFEVDGESETELRYEHFSVVMSRSRRMCFFSAVQHRRQPVEEEHARRLEMGPAHSESAADHEGMLRQPAEVQPRSHDPARGSGLGRRRRPPSAATRTRCTSPTRRRRCRRSMRRSGWRSRTTRSSTPAKTT